MTKYHTIGEIFRLKLLKNHKGQPYNDKSAVARIVNTLNYKERDTPWGPAKVVSQSEINRHNKRYETTSIL